MQNKMLTTNISEIKVNYKKNQKKLVPIEITTKGAPIKEITTDIEKIYIAGTTNAL